eukprot:6172682-Prymnesium_polylepis.1
MSSTAIAVVCATRPSKWTLAAARGCRCRCRAPTSGSSPSGSTCCPPANSMRCSAKAASGSASPTAPTRSTCSCTS